MDFLQRGQRRDEGALEDERALPLTQQEAAHGRAEELLFTPALGQARHSRLARVRSFAAEPTHVACTRLPSAGSSAA